MHRITCFALLPHLAKALDTKLPATRQPLLCSEQEFNRTKYSCWPSPHGGSLLCPRDNGAYYGLCGDACYFPYHYTCNDDTQTLVSLPIRTAPFNIISHSDILGQQHLQARNNRFYLGGKNNAYCFLSHGECPMPMRETVFNADSSLAVYAKGGQQTYIMKNGTMSFTEAQNSSKPEMLYESAGTAYWGGGFIGPNGTSWAGCEDGDGERYVVAVPAEASEVPEGCEHLVLWTMTQPEGIHSAYQYGMEGRPGM